MPTLQLDGRPFDGDLIVFDKDGVLLDFHHLWAEVTRMRVASLCDRAGNALEAELLALLGLDAEGRVAPGGLLAGGTRHESTLAAATRLHQVGWPWHRARQAALDAFAEADTRLDYAALARPLPGVVEALEALHGDGWKLAIATTDQSIGAVRFTASIGMRDHFTALVGVDQVQRSKPAPDLFLKACAIAGVAPGRALMVGDLDIDLKMARDAGALGAIGVLSGVGDAALLGPLADVVLPGVAGLIAQRV